MSETKPFYVTREALQALAAIAQEAGHPRYPRTDSVRTQAIGGRMEWQATDGRAAVILSHRLQPEQQQKEFPSLDKVVPSGKPLASMRINPILLLPILELAAQVYDEALALDHLGRESAGDYACTLEIYGSNKPIVIRVRNGTEAELTGLLMPLAGSEPK